MADFNSISEVEALHWSRHDRLVQLYAFDILTLDGEDLRGRTLPAQDQPSTAA